MSTRADRWAMIDALFAEVLARPLPERDAFLAAATTGDPDLRSDVLRLLTSLDDAEARIGEGAAAFLSLGTTEIDGAAIDASLLDHPPSDPLDEGTPLGPYRIVRELGRGGMGAVYLATRADAAFDRLVAIKVVRYERDTPARRRRFLSEQRLLARLEHANIARLYDSGTTDAGRPFLVMEHVQGLRIDEYADHRRLTVRARVELLLSVCDAVSFAHQRLIVHRDLKPANVLVDERGTVKLLDFGIAALLDAADDDAADGMTTPRMLTPDYASPEQTRGEFVGAAGDVYSLGILLHELLVGSTPPSQRLVRAHASTAAIEAALSPASRVLMDSGATADRAAIAAARATTPDRLRDALAGDLDAVLLAALAPRPERRYASVDALRDDLQRVLDQRPISVRGDARSYRIHRFVQRNRILVGLGALATVLALGFMTSIVVQSRRLAVERDISVRERERAEQVAGFLTGLFEAADPFGATDPDTVRAAQLLAAGAARLDSELAGQPALHAEMLTVLGGIFQNLNRTDEARTMLERAVAARRADPATPLLELAASLSKLGEVFRSESRFDDAERALTEALTLIQRAGDGGRRTLPGALADLGRLMNETNRFDSASVLYDQSLAALRAQPVSDTTLLVLLLTDRGWLASRLGNDSLSLAMSQQALAIQRAYQGDAHPTTLTIIGNVAYQLDQLGRSREAVPLHREAVQGLQERLGDEHRAVSLALSNLSASLARTGASLEAVRAAEEAVRTSRRRTGGVHPDVAISLNYLASAYEAAGRTNQMLAALEESHALHVRTLGARAPGTAIMLARLGGARCTEGTARRTQLRALDDLRGALAVLDSVFPPPHPQRIARHLTFATCLVRAGQVDAGRSEASRQAELAWSNHPPSATIVASALLSWRRVSLAGRDTAAVVRIDRLADSLGVRLPSP